MLSMTRKADYALVAMSELARHAPKRLSARRIAEAVRVPLPVLTAILHQLLHQGLVTSTRGAQGGYCLAKPAGEISLGELIEAVEGPAKLTLCCSEESAAAVGDTKCDLEVGCRIKEPLRRVHRSLQHFLSQVDLAYIAFDSEPVVLLGNSARVDRDVSRSVVKVSGMAGESVSRGHAEP